MIVKLMDGKRPVGKWDAHHVTWRYPQGEIVELEITDQNYKMTTITLPEDGDTIYFMDAATGRTTDAYRWPEGRIAATDKPEIRKEFRAL